MIEWKHVLPFTNRVWCAECEARLTGDEIGLCAKCLEAKQLFWAHHAERLEEEPTGDVQRPQRRA